MFSWSNNTTCSTVLEVLQLRNQMLGCTIQQSVALVYFSGALIDGFPLNTFIQSAFKYLEMRILSGVEEFVSLWSS